MAKTFIDFVLNQPPSRVIDHDGDLIDGALHSAWEGCAVGDYCREVLGCGREHFEGQRLTQADIKELIDDQFIYDELNCSLHETYGDLQKSIARGY